MKITIQQLPQQLVKSIAPIYIISGDETLLVQETQDTIRAAAVKAGFSERIRVDIEPGSEWANLFFNHTQSLSLFAAQRIIELDLTTAKLNAASSKILQEYASKPSPDIVLIIRAAKLDSKTEQSNWYKALDKIAVIIPIWPITPEQLPAWITQRAKKLNLSLTPAAANLLAQQVEGNLLAAAQELEKLGLLQENSQPIDAAMIENAVADNAHFDIFTLVDSALAGNRKRCLRILENLAAEDTEPAIVLWALAREIRTLSDMQKQLQQGAALTQLFPKFRIWEKRQPAVRAFLQRRKHQPCWDLLLRAAEIDRMIKGAETGNVWNQLEQLTLAMV